MAYENILYSVADHVATITLNRPDARNALSPALLSELLDALKTARADNDVRVVVLTGAGDKAFCAGGDLGGGGGQMPTPYERYEGSRQFVDYFRTMATLDKPTVARVNGYCLAGGFGLALGCDFVIAHDGVQFGTPEVDRGLWPMMIMAVIFRNVPRKFATELIYFGEKVSAADALRMGVCNRVVPQDRLDATVAEFAGKLAKKSPAILRLGRRAFYTMSDMTLEQALEYLNAMLAINMQTEDAMEGIMAFFGKREPDWKGK